MTHHDHGVKCHDCGTKNERVTVPREDVKGHWVEEFTDKNGVKHPRHWIGEHEVPKHTFTRKQRFVRGGDHTAKVELREGRLKKYGYALDKPAEERHAALRRAIEHTRGRMVTAHRSARRGGKVKVRWSPYASVHAAVRQGFRLQTEQHARTVFGEDVRWLEKEHAAGRI